MNFINSMNLLPWQIQTFRQGGGHPDYEIRVGPQKIFFRLFIALFWSKNKGGPSPPRPHPWIRHCGNY